jgi:methanogenic corrinoid protein MtbC1
MTEETMLERLVHEVSELQEEQALATVRQILESETEPALVLDACRDAMAIVGKRFEEGLYFVPELVLAGELLSEIKRLAQPKLAGSRSAERVGKVVIGTVKGDIHDIGKDIVAFMLDANGFEVHDLGVDVPPAAFVEKARLVGADIVALSGLLTVVFEPMKATVNALRGAGLRENLKVMIGGAPVNEKVREYTGADAWGADATAAVEFAKAWTRGR